MTLPVIDFSDLKQGNPRWESVKKQVRKALEEYGCFQALYGEIPQILPKCVLDGIQRLFDLPLPIKQGHGYIGQIPFIPLYESMSIEDVLAPGIVETFTNRLWSDGNPTFSKSIHSFSEKLSELDKNVRRMVLESFELVKYMDEHLNSTNYVLRVQKYDAPHSHENKVGLAAHTDKHMVTILCQNEVDGLEILTKDGQWIDAKLSPNSFLVIAGDSFHAWTNGRVHSVDHRVMMKGDIARYSVKLHSLPNAGYMINAPKELVDEEHPRLFRPYDYAKFMDFFYSRPEKMSLAALKQYCVA